MKALKKLNRLRSPGSGKSQKPGEDGAASVGSSPSMHNSTTHHSSGGDDNNSATLVPTTASSSSSSSLQSATAKLTQSATPYPLTDLPKDRSDPLWNEIRQEYGLTLPELGALKNSILASEGSQEEIEVAPGGQVDIVQRDTTEEEEEADVKEEPPKAKEEYSYNPFNGILLNPFGGTNSLAPETTTTTTKTVATAEEKNNGLENNDSTHNKKKQTNNDKEKIAEKTTTKHDDKGDDDSMKKNSSHHKKHHPHHKKASAEEDRDTAAVASVSSASHKSSEKNNSDAEKPKKHNKEDDDMKKNSSHHKKHHHHKHKKASTATAEDGDSAAVVASSSQASSEKNSSDSDGDDEDDPEPASGSRDGDHKKSSSSNTDDDSDESDSDGNNGQEMGEEDHDNMILGDDGGEFDDLDNMLADLDVDKDYQCWTSFRNIMQRKTNSADGNDNDKYQGADEELMESYDIEKWENRLQRDEVFSRRYRPSKGEQKELSELEEQLGLKVSMTNFFSSFSSCSNWKQLVHPDPKKQQPGNVLLKRGPVLFQSSSFSSAENGAQRDEAEFILFTHGFTVARVTVQTPPEPDDSQKQPKQQPSSAKGTVSRKFFQAVLLESVVCVAPDSDDECGWEIVVRTSRGQEKLGFLSASPRQQAAWLKALEIVLINHYMHDKKFQQDLGWQYRLVHKPGFTRSVLGVEDDLLLPVGSTIDDLDSYNGYAPLHYAVRLKHTNIVQSLLDEKAEPNVSDADGRTPVVHAVHDEAPEELLKLLVRYGGHGVDKAKQERSELLDRVTATQQEREERREQQQQKEALVAQAKMSENMRLLQERGQKIDAASDKAQQINENAYEYADLARQLKEKTKKQANWNPFARK